MSGGPPSSTSTSGSNSSGTTNILSKYVIPGLEAIGGAVSEFFAPGNPFGVGLIGSGVGQLAGGAAGGSQGQSLGGTLGGLGGGLSGSLGGASGSANPLTAVDSAATQSYALPTTGSPATSGTSGLGLANALGAGASSLGSLVNASKLQPPPNAPVLSKTTGTISNPTPPSPVQTVGAYSPGSGSSGLSPQLMQLVAQLLQGRTA